MPDLIAQGREARQRWRRHLAVGQSLPLGRGAGGLSVGWDDRISRRHAMLCWDGRTLAVTVERDARNPVFFGGEAQTRFAMRPGQHFVIGQTTFTLSDERAEVSLDAPLPVTEQAYSPQQLAAHRYASADNRIESLSRLPEIIASASGDAELHARLVSAVLGGVPSAQAAAVVQMQEAGGPVTVLHWDRRKDSSGDFHPSDRLIRAAIVQKQALVHVWEGAGGDPGGAFTESADEDWAFCTPLAGEACRGWAIYVTGAFPPETERGTGPSPDLLQDDLKFTELVATTVGSLRALRLLERNRTSLAQFFSPVVLEQLAGQDPDQVLAPREAEVVVLFCDLRGFAQQTEQAGEQLFDLLRRVSQALGVMTHQILEHGGVVGDFHGDAAMGFWGWPLAQPDAAVRACRAAVGIRSAFEDAARLHDGGASPFRIGIGLAAGRAVAGKIGTVDQVKVTVFGPVVNLASRLEGMTKQLRAPILMDAAVAAAARAALPVGEGRVRLVGKFRPYGLSSAVEVSELLPPEAELPQISGEHIAHYEAAVAALTRGDFEQAFERLHQVPAIDRVKDFLTVFIAQHNRTSPPHWDGAIPLAAK